MLYKNRFLALALSLALLCAMLPLGMMNAFAARTQSNANSLPPSTTTRFIVPETRVGTGVDNVTVSLAYETEDVVTYGTFVVEFPSDKLRLITPTIIDRGGTVVLDPNSLSPMPTVVVNVDESGSGIVKVAFSTAESLPQNGTLIDLPFEIVDPSSEGEYPITVWAKEWYDDYGNNHVAASSIIASGNLTVTSELNMSKGDYEYTLINDASEVQITGYTGAGGEVVIPDTLDDKPVTRIGYAAFENCTSLTSITIPNNVTEIGRYAFCGCTALANVTLAQNLTDISYAAFSLCSSLVEVALPNAVIRIDGCSFAECTSLERVTIPNSVTEIGQDAFYNCDALTIYGDGPSCAQDYALENEIPFVAFTPKKPVQLKDEQSGVQTEYADGSTFDEGLTLSIKPIEAGSILVSLKKYEKFSLLDITLLKNGQTIQPESPLIVRIPVPANMTPDKCQVVHVADNGLVSNMHATLEGDMLVFVVTRFSYYAVVEKTEMFGDVNSDDKVNTTDARQILQYAAGLIGGNALKLHVADVTGDGKVNTTDARSILQLSAGIIDHFPVEKDA